MKNFILFFIAFFLLKNANAHFGSKGPYGGSISCGIAYDSTIYLGTESGGVYFSTNTFLTAWSAKPVGLKSGKITALAHSGKYLFAGTADSGVYIFTGFVGTDRYWKKINVGLTNLKITSLVAIDSISVMAGTSGGGIFLTTNKGISWSAANNAVLHHMDITGLVKAGNRIIHSSDGGVWASDDKGSSWIDFNDLNTEHIDADMISYNAGTNQILLKNANGLFLASSASTTLTPVYLSADNGLPLGVQVKSISNNGSDWYLATNKGVFVSSSATINWRPENLNLFTLDVNTVVPFQSRLVVGTKKEGIFKSSASTVSWASVNTGYNNLETYAVLCSGASLVITSNEKGVFVSNNLATSYVRANKGLSDSLHVNDLSFFGSSIVAATKNAGVFISADTGKNWSPMNNGISMLNITKVTEVAGKLFMFNANGEVFQYQSSSWVSDQNGLPTGVIPMSLIAHGTRLYMATNGNGVFYRDIAGTIVWTAVNNGLSNLHVTSLTANTMKVFAGTWGSGVFVLDPISLQWTPASALTISHTSLMGLNGNLVDAMAFYAGYVFASYRGGLLASSDDGATWIAGGNQFNLPSYSLIKKITFVTTRVFVTTENNCIYSNALSELPPITVGIASAAAKENEIFTVYPNPSNGAINIHFSSAAVSSISLSIIDLCGRLVLTKNGTDILNGEIIELKLPSGVYFCEAWVNNERQVKKILIE